MALASLGSRRSLGSNAASKPCAVTQRKESVSKLSSWWKKMWNLEAEESQLETRKSQPHATLKGTNLRVLFLLGIIYPIVDLLLLELVDFLLKLCEV